MSKNKLQWTLNDRINDAIHRWKDDSSFYVSLRTESMDEDKLQRICEAFPEFVIHTGQVHPHAPHLHFARKGPTTALPISEIEKMSSTDTEGT